MHCSLPVILLPSTAEDAEIKVPFAENPELLKAPSRKNFE